MRIIAVSNLSVDDRNKVKSAVAASLATSTRRAYLGHWNAFVDWAGRHNYDAYPAAPETVAAHLAGMAATSSVSTLRVRRAAIGSVHRAMGLPDPTTDELVKRALGGLVRKLGTAPSQAPPLTARAFETIRATACLRRSGGNIRRRRESEGAAKRRGLVDIALCSVMRDALLRREEAAALTWGDIVCEIDGSGRLTVQRAKNDQDASGTLLYLGPQAMRDLAAIRPVPADPASKVFRLSGSQVSRRIATAARAAGLGEGFSGHSPRVGMAQDLAANGATLPELMQAGRWKSSAMPALYTRSQAAGRGAVAKYYAVPNDRTEDSSQGTATLG